MPTLRVVKDLIYRVHITPAPRTQSESGAILRRLQDIGPVSTFKIHRAAPDLGAKHKDDQQIFATLIFAHDTKALRALQKDKTQRTLHVTANANIPDAATIDPYNARGLKTRKPALAPRTFQCSVQPAEDFDADGNPTSSDILEQLQNNDYAGLFTVDRRSILGEILAKTDAPSGLIHGLLPRIDDRYRDQTYKSNSARNFEEWAYDDGDEAALDSHALLGDGEVVMKSLDLARSFSDDTSGAATNTGISPDASIDVRTTTTEDFAALKDFSLMDMYRNAIDEGAGGSSPHSDSDPLESRTSSTRRDARSS